MSKNSKVSVIVVSHDKYLPYLRTALDSLKSQVPHELILVLNGCSADVSADKVISIPPTTLATACNVGISEATGDYIVRLDADDWVDSDLLLKEQEYLDNNPHADCVWCDYVEALKSNEGEDWEVFLLEVSPQHVLEHACGAMYRKTVWENLGGYDEDLEYQEAFDFWQRFHHAGYKAERIEVPMYLYRKGHGSMSTNPIRDAVRKQLEEKYGK